MVEPGFQESAPVPAAGALASRATIGGECGTATGPPDSFEFLDTQEVHVWVCDLNVSMPALDRFKKVLAASEIERSARFHFDRHRDHYIASHGFLREVIARYLSVAPGDVQFEHTPRGKPFLGGSAGTSGMQFNLAHSDALAVLAISPRARIGVDVERVRQLPDAEELVSRFFSKREAGEFRALPDALRDEAFFNLWTRKEAWLKATGEGIAHLLAQVEVSFLPTAPACLLALPKDYNEGSKWSLSSMVPATGFVGAIAAEMTEIKPLLHSWNLEVKEAVP